MHHSLPAKRPALERPDKSEIRRPAAQPGQASEVGQTAQRGAADTCGHFHHAPSTAKRRPASGAERLVLVLEHLENSNQPRKLQHLASCRAESKEERRVGKE